MIWMSLLLIILWSPLLFLWMLGPNKPRRKAMRPFEKVYIAHRGLHNASEGVPENSLTAFRKAVEAGYGVEMDLQLTKDGKLVVFHDKSLERMCGVQKDLVELTYEELQEYRLLGTDEKIPLFDEVLKIINGKVPMIIEMKPEGHCIRATKMACKRLERYRGIYCIESFHPACIWWVRMHYPKIPRGQLSMNYFIEEPDIPLYQKVVMTSMVFNFFTRPDFISYKHSQKDQFTYRLLRRLYWVENVAWTIQSQEQLEEAKDVFKVMIFDSFIPK
ncbi:MAG: glycerophosphodiester phosphodiesterase [Lachnospiraceae bacterium]|nr:glycerophosphodiester phosphodiesterase [Lachnospiraceae bacterium]